MRLRLILSFILIVFVSVASVVLVARNSAAGEVGRFMLSSGMTDAPDLVERLEDYYRAQGSWQGVEALLDARGHSRGQGSGGGMMGGMGSMANQRLRLAAPDGSLIFDSAADPVQAPLSAEERGRAISLRSGLRTVGLLLAEGGMGFSQTAEGRLVTRLNNAALAAGLISAGVSLLLAMLLAYYLLRPVRELTRAAARLAAGDLGQRVQARQGDELGELGRAFNHMANSLQQAEASRRAMTADIAHELRNPLAVQRANLEALQDGIYPLTAESLEPVLAQNLLLERLVEDLRTLALAESGQLRLERVPTDLAALAEGVLDRFRPQAAERQIGLEFSNPAPGRHLVEVDPLRVEQILNNLLANAVRYTPAGGRIKLALSSQAADQPVMVQLSVRDTGPGIPPEALGRIFERFYRAERSRSRSEGGTGLGLAIARQLARAHGGELVAANHPEGGAVFTLALPLALDPGPENRPTNSVF